MVPVAPFYLAVRCRPRGADRTDEPAACSNGTYRTFFFPAIISSGKGAAMRYPLFARTADQVHALTFPFHHGVPTAGSTPQIFWPVYDPAYEDLRWACRAKKGLRVGQDVQEEGGCNWWGSCHGGELVLDLRVGGCLFDDMV